MSGRKLTILAATMSLVSPALIVAPVAAQGLPPVEREFANGSTLQFYGQINKGILSYDDGREERTYGLIDNDNSGTRFGFLYTRDFDEWTFQNVNEFSYAPFSTSNANLTDESPSFADFEWSNDNIRKIDFTLDNERYGKFWAGQGSMATDGIAWIDLSGTDVIAYTGVADTAAGQILRFSDAALADDLDGPQIGDVFLNYNGDRRVRIRYDTPGYSGFVFAAAYGRNLLSDSSDIRDQNILDASINYGNDFDAVEIAAGIGYSWTEDGATVWSGSASALYSPTGINLTLAAGSSDDDGDTATMWYGKVGLLRDFVDWGATAMSVDYYSGEDMNLSETVTSSDSTSWGLALVQNIDRANTELWLTYRSYEYDDDFASYDDGQAIFGGARFSF